MSKVSLEDFICEYLAHNDHLLAEEVCDYFIDSDKATNYCYKVCEYSYPQSQCYKKFFEERFKTWDIGDDK